MNFIATVNAPAHGNIAVTFSDIEKRVLGAWRDNETVELSAQEKCIIARDIIGNRRYSRVFEKAYVVNSGFGTFVFPVRSGRFCQSKLIEFATQISVWIKTQSSNFPTMKQYRRGCGSPTMRLNAKTLRIPLALTHGNCFALTLC